MKYRRKTTRPPRSAEQSAAMREAAELRAEVTRLRSDLGTTRADLQSAKWWRDALERDMAKLVVELREERTKNRFLCGFDGLGHEPWDIRRLF